MASTKTNRTKTPTRADEELFALRTRAQRHLEQIEADLEVEQEFEENRRKELERENHINKRERARMTTTSNTHSADEEGGKKKKFRSAQGEQTSWPRQCYTIFRHSSYYAGLS